MWKITTKSCMPQAGIDQPRQSHATYEASGLPPSHHGWIGLDKFNIGLLYSNSMRLLFKWPAPFIQNTMKLFLFVTFQDLGQQHFSRNISLVKYFPFIIIQI